MGSLDLKKTQMSDLVDESINKKPTIAAISSSSSCSSSSSSSRKRNCSSDQLVRGGARKRMVVVGILSKEEDLMDSEKIATISLVKAEESGRDKLKRHRREMAGRVWIPETWGQEAFLEDWKDCNVIDRSLFPTGLLSARDALVEECRKANSGRVRTGNSC